MIYIQFGILIMAVVVVVVTAILNDEFRYFLCSIITIILVVGAIITVGWAAEGVWDYYYHPRETQTQQLERQ